MRIVGGKYGGRVLPPLPRGFKARPTTDSARENLFNILENFADFASSDALDLFAGTGAVSCEFVSRGCRSVDTVEIDPLHFAYIRKTAETFGFVELHAVRNDAFRFLGFCRKTYDIIFADPPFACEKTILIPSLVTEHRLLKEGGRLVIEHPAGRDFSDAPGFVESRHYGSVNFSFFLGV
ncbi:MAG: RsmD family RNA methyltransferase [Prevotellaceae bacterium]|jgi:16S rRNA (guanine(966)-N(2))-methyltransferase RsmD|nr:RsmD family RNA methyltransferase [Prevotellaceae bacterium]